MRNWLIGAIFSFASIAGAQTPVPSATPEATPDPATPVATPGAAPEVTSEVTPDASPAPSPTPEVASDDLAAMSLEELLDVEIASASKFSQRASDAPSIVSVTTREQIRDQGWTSLNDVLFSLPGFSISQDYERVTVGSRGLFESWNNNHLLVLIDGVPYNDNETGGAYTWEITPLFLAKSVETIRGPGSALYGSSAMNGVVAVNTVDPPAGGGGLARVRLGDYATRSYSAMAGSTGKLLSALVAFDGFETGGNEYRSRDGSGRSDSNGDRLLFRVQDDRKNSYVFAKFLGNGALEGWSLQLHNQDWSYETGHGWFFAVPDVGESMQESRQIATLRFREDVGALGQDYVVRYQRHNIHHNMRFLPSGAYDGYYPGGVTEFLETHVEDVFARAQISAQLPRDIRVLGGVEQSTFFYWGDDKHFSNADLSDVDGGYPPRSGPEPLGAYYEPILDHPVNSTGAFVQLVSGEALGKLVTATVGLRYDSLWFNYDDAEGEQFKSYEQLSPRLGLVLRPTESLSVKALAGRAFRAPAPVELFGANTWALASNIAELKPEYVTTYELAADWKISRVLSWRSNVYYAELENQIAYGSLNLLRNIYSHANAGVESELLYGFDVPKVGHLGGWLSVAHVEMLEEKVLDPSISREDEVTWAPADTAKAGATLTRGAGSVSMNALFQGVSKRRESDQVTTENLFYRPPEVPGFARIDLAASWRFMKTWRAGLRVQNATGQRHRIIKNGDYPFDYRLPGRRVLATVELEL